MTDETPAIPLHARGAGAPVLLLHDMGMNRHAWDGMAGLADQYTLLTPDLPGHGDAPVPAAAWYVEDLSDQLAQTLRAQGFNRVHVVGHGLGGMIAQYLAANDPALVERLVLCDTTPAFHDEDRAAWHRRAAAARQAGPAMLAVELEAAWFTPAFLTRSPPALADVRTMLANTPGEGLAQACTVLAHLDLADLMPEIYARTLVLVGEQASLTARDAADWLAQHIAGARFAEVPHAARASIIEQPGWLMQVLRAFLA